MNHLINEQLSDRVQQDSYGQQMADCRHPAPQQFLALVGVETQGENIGGLSALCVSQSATHSEQDGHQGLQDEPEAPGTRETLWQVLEKLPGKQINTPRLKRLPNCPRKRRQDHQDHERCENPVAI